MKYLLTILTLVFSLSAYSETVDQVTFVTGGNKCPMWVEGYFSRTSSTVPSTEKTILDACRFTYRISYQGNHRFYYDTGASDNAIYYMTPLQYENFLQIITPTFIADE